MERGTAKTLRILGIIATVFLTLAACGILLLLSLCSGLDRPNPPRDAIGFAVGAIVVMLAGIWIIVTLARGLMRASRQAQTIPVGATPPPPGPPLTAPVLISREGQMAVDLVVFVLCASLIFSVVSLFLNQLYYSSFSHTQQRTNLLLIHGIILVLHNAPYAILLYSFLTKPARWTFYYAASIPAALLLQTLFNISTMAAVYWRTPRLFLLTGITSAIEIAVMALAWRATVKNGIKPVASTLVVAGLAALLYFIIVRSGTVFLYARLWR